jgi:hypothetical protein
MITKREINAGNIPDDYPVIRRFFAAVFTIIAKGTEKDFKNFCLNNNIESRHLERNISEPWRQFNPQHLTALVIKYHISAHWLLTGSGNMYQSAD